MGQAAAYQERLSVLKDRRAEVTARREACEAQWAELVREGKPTGDLHRQIDAHNGELSELDKEIGQLEELAAQRFAADKLRTDREDFNAANRSLAAKRASLPSVRDEAFRAVAEAAGRLRDHVRELDALEASQAQKAAELNRTAQALGELADFALPEEQRINTGQPYSRPDAKDFAVSRAIQLARSNDRRAYLNAVGEAAYIFAEPA